MACHRGTDRYGVSEFDRYVVGSLDGYSSPIVVGSSSYRRIEFRGVEGGVTDDTASRPDEAVAAGDGDDEPADVIVYAGSDGRFYSGWQLDRRLAAAEWRPCIRDRVVDRRLVETHSGDLLMLERTSIEALPTWAEARADGSAVRIVDTRRALPPD